MLLRSGRSATPMLLADQRSLHQSAARRRKWPRRCNQGPLGQRQGWTAACALTMLYMELRQQASRNPAVPFCSPSNRPGFGSLKTKLYDLVCSLPLYPSRVKKAPFPPLRRLEASGRWSSAWISVQGNRYPPHSLHPTTAAPSCPRRDGNLHPAHPHSACCPGPSSIASIFRLELDF